jgi:glycerophosphoryl diester phosphodiesterase
VNLRSGGGRPLVIGHRGAGAVAPDNSLEGLAAAIAAGADLVEFDVGPGLLLGHSPRELPPRPLSLDDAFDFLAASEAGIHVDLKVVGIEPEIAAAVRRHGLAERVIVSSTWARSLRRFARLSPELPRAIGYPRDRYGAARVPWPVAATTAAAGSLRAVMPARVPALLGLARANVLALHHALVSPAVLRATHAHGAALFVWSADDAVLVERLAALGVDGIVSGDPEMAAKVLATLNQA